jgi:hypothetical protein
MIEEPLGPEWDAVEVIVKRGGRVRPVFKCKHASCYFISSSHLVTKLF